MAKLIVCILLIMIVFLLWYLLFKPQLALSSKLNIQALAKRKGISEPKQDVAVELRDETEHKVEQSRFDAVAKLFFDQNIQSKTIENAEQIQANFLNKMPAATRSQIGEFDLGEWCIYWSYKEQSLEYYVGRYGVFCTHVDCQGVEHKLEFKVGS